MTMATDVTEGAERLIASAEQNDGIMLGELAQAELCTLRGEAVSLVCERTRRWWTQLSTDERRELGHLALELMVIRGLLRPPPGSSAVQMYESGQLANEHLSPELAVILAARAGPRPQAACQVPGLDDLNWCHPRFFGITSPERRLRVLVCEVLTDKPAGLHGQPALGTILRYTLMTPERSAQMITSWAGLIRERRRLSALATVTIVRPGGLSTLDQERYEIRPDRGTFVVTRSGPDGVADPAMRLNEAGTIMEMASALTRAAL